MPTRWILHDRAKPCRQLSGESLDHDHAADRGPLPDLECLRVLGGLVPVTRRGRVWELEDDDPPRRIVALQQLGLAAPGEIPPAMQLDRVRRDGFVLLI